MTKEQLEEIEKRANAATRGPWTVRLDSDCDLSVWADDGVYNVCGISEYNTFPLFETDKSNAAFVAHARQDIPALIARVRELEMRCAVVARELKLKASLAVDGLPHSRGYYSYTFEALQAMADLLTAPYKEVE